MMATCMEAPKCLQSSPDLGPFFLLLARRGILKDNLGGAFLAQPIYQ